MARELKHYRWDLLKPARRTQLMRYPWHEWMNGSAWLLLQGEDFDMDPKEFQAYMLSFARENAFNVKTMLNREKTGVFLKNVSISTPRRVQVMDEWRERWEHQQRSGLDEWWNHPERLDDFRTRRNQKDRPKRTQASQPKEEGPYVPGWQRHLERKAQEEDR